MGEAPKSNMPKTQSWFAVYTCSRHEKSAAKHLLTRGIEHYLPLYRSKRRWADGSKVTVELPLFPGYIFVHIDRRERVRVLEVPGVLSMVGSTSRQPVAIPDGEIEALRNGLCRRAAEPHPLLKIGQRARIWSGPFAGLEGVVLRNGNNLRVVLTVDTIMRSIAVEVDETELAPVCPEPVKRVEIMRSAFAAM